MKKASFLISGITTVALLAAAVGSFAAWDTLTSDKNELTVSVSNPVVLKVSNVKNSTTQAKIAPKLESGDITDLTRSQEVEVGTFDASLANTDGVADLKTKVAPTITGVTAANYTVEVYDGITKVANLEELPLVDTDKTFTVKIKVNDSADLTADKGKPININLAFTTSK